MTWGLVSNSHQDAPIYFVSQIKKLEVAKATRVALQKNYGIKILSGCLFIFAFYNFSFEIYEPLLGPMPLPGRCLTISGHLLDVLRRFFVVLVAMIEFQAVRNLLFSRDFRTLSPRHMLFS